MAVFYLSLVHAIPLLLVGLALGTRTSSIAAATAVAVVALANPMSGLVFGVLYATPAWLIVRLMLTGPYGVIRSIPAGQKVEAPDKAHDPSSPTGDLGWFPAGYIVAVITAMGAALIVTASLLTGGGLEENVTLALTAMANAFAGPQGEEVLQQAVLSLVPYFAGMAAGMWAFGVLVNMVIAQSLVAKGGRNLRPSPRLRELVLPDWLSWALVGSALLALITSGELEYIGQNTVIVLAVPFFLLGLAVVHKLASLTPFRGAMLGMIYLVILFSGWFVLVIAGLGILEQWVGLKSRMKKST
ncbi:MAG: DUF2232 domain-containing protein [Magnetovibrio sp.]|nr:DUF2232 domain-containing protein [Magnetovibrio sp.]